jgi:hypothetical protein
MFYFAISQEVLTSAFNRENRRIFRGCPKVRGMTNNFKMQGNVFALLQIFNAIPSPPFSAPAELRMINLNN